MAGIEETIFNTIKTVLEKDATLSTYIENVYDGLKAQDDDFVPDTVRNYIVLEPLSAEEENAMGSDTLRASSGVYKSLKMTIGIVGVITAINSKQFSYVTGWGKNKGIIDLDQDIKNAIDNSNDIQDLADGTINVSTQSFIFETFPKRKVVIALEIGRNFRKGGR